MSALALTTVGRVAMLAGPGLAARADAGGVSRIQIFAVPQPLLAGDSVVGDPLVTLVLARPCGVMDAGVLTLLQADLTGDIILHTGSALWGRWLAGDGAVLADGAVTDAAGAGPFKLTNTSGLILFAGGRAVLGPVALT